MKSLRWRVIFKVDLKVDLKVNFTFKVNIKVRFTFKMTKFPKVGGGEFQMKCAQI